MATRSVVVKQGDDMMKRTHFVPRTSTRPITLGAFRDQEEADDVLDRHYNRPVTEERRAWRTRMAHSTSEHLVDLRVWTR